MRRSTIASAMTGSSKSLSHLRVDLRGHDHRCLLVAFFENIHQRSGFFMAIRAQPQIIEDEDFGFDETADVLEVPARGLDGLNFLEQEVHGQKQRGVAFLAQPLAQGDGQMGFAHGSRTNRVRHEY